MSDKKIADVSSLNKQAFGLIIGLCLQYILGITTTIFVQFPEHLSKSQLWEFAWKQIPLALHILLGLFLVIGSFALLVRALKVKSRKWIIASTIGVVVLLVTTFSGALFVDKQSDMYSFIMAIGFIVALFAYIWGLYKAKHICN